MLVLMDAFTRLLLVTRVYAGCSIPTSPCTVFIASQILVAILFLAEVEIPSSISLFSFHRPFFGPTPVPLVFDKDSHA